jgi:hypothetical protein
MSHTYPTSQDIWNAWMALCVMTNGNDGGSARLCKAALKEKSSLYDDKIVRS